MTRQMLYIWVALMGSFALLLIAIGLVRGEIFLIVAGIVVIGIQALKWQILRRE
jgi:hypothetical protein